MTSEIFTSWITPGYARNRVLHIGRHAVRAMQLRADVRISVCVAANRLFHASGFLCTNSTISRMSGAYGALNLRVGDRIRFRSNGDSSIEIVGVVRAHATWERFLRIEGSETLSPPPVRASGELFIDYVFRVKAWIESGEWACHACIAQMRASPHQMIHIRPHETKSVWVVSYYDRATCFAQFEHPTLLKAALAVLAQADPVQYPLRTESGTLMFPEN